MRIIAVGIDLAKNGRQVAAESVSRLDSTAAAAAAGRAVSKSASAIGVQPISQTGGMYLSPAYVMGVS